MRTAGLKAILATGLAATLLISSGLALADGHGDGHNHGDQQEQARFSDTTQVPWASAAIQDMVSLGILQGQGNAQFNPSGDTTRAEIATVLGRLMQWQAPSAPGPGFLPPGLSRFRNPRGIPVWARAYVALAVEDGLIMGFPGHRFEPNGRVTWDEVAVLVARVFKYPSLAPNQVQAELSQLQFGAHTPPWAQEAVAEDVAAGDFSSTLSVLYRPNQPISRAELALFLFQAMSASKSNGSGQNPPASQNLVTGTVQSAAPGSLVVAQNGSNVTVAVSPTATVYENSAPEPYASVQVGDTVTVVLVNGTAQVIDITAAPQAPQGVTLSGTISALSAGMIALNIPSGPEVTLPVQPNVSVTIGGQTENYGALAVGDQATVTLDAQAHVMAIDVTQAPSSSQITGQVTAMAAGFMGLRLSNGTLVTLPFASNVQITDANGQSISISAISPGDSVVVALNAQGEVQSIQIQQTQSGTVTGTVTALTSNSLTVQPQGQNPEVLPVLSNASVTGQVSSYSALVVGDQVTVSLDNLGQVVAIDVLQSQPSTVTGTVSAVTANSLTVQPQGQNPEVLPVVDNVAVSGQRSSYSALAVGDQVTVSLNNLGQVVAIDVTAAVSQNTTLQGTVTAITSSILSLQESNSTVVLPIDASVKVVLNNQTVALSDVTVGDQVKVTLNDQDVISQIEITQVSVVGTVTGYLTSANTTTAEVYTPTGLKAYTLMSDATIKVDGNNASIAQVPVGDALSLGLAANGQVATLTATKPASPVVESSGILEGQSSGTITIWQQNSGFSTVNVGADPVAVNGQNTVALSSISSGTPVVVDASAVSNNSALVIANP